MAERIMTERVRKMLDRTRIHDYPLLATKAKIWYENYRTTDGLPEIIRRSLVIDAIAKNIPIFIEDGELIVGNTASKPMGLEISFWSGLWPDNEIEGLKNEKDGNGFIVADDTVEEMYRQNEFWKYNNFTYRAESLFDPKTTMPFLEKGGALPVWKKGTGWAGRADTGMGTGPYYLLTVEYEEVLRRGMLDYVREAEEELGSFRIVTHDDCRKKDFLKAVINTLHAVMAFAKRFSDLAAEMAEKEEDPVRKAELIKISENCARVPAYPARTLYEALQCVWFIFLFLNPNPTCSFGRMDQYLYPYYKADKEAGRITEEEAIELFECLRIKDMQMNRTGSKAHRQKWSGLAKWHNCILGGVDKDGNDVTNEVSYLILEAAYRTHCPHHTITVRVHEGSPIEFLKKAFEVVATGCGLPAFISDKSYMQYLLDKGVPLEEARNYSIGGCIDPVLPGKSRILAQPMIIAPLALEWAMNNGKEMQHGQKIGLDLGYATDYKTFDEFFEAVKKELAWEETLAAEHNNAKSFIWNEKFPDPMSSMFMHDAIKIGRNIMDRVFPYESAAVLCCVGMVNVANSLAVIKKLVYEDKTLTMEQLKNAIDSDWAGEENEKIRQMCKAVPKYGNNDEYVDSILAELYEHWSKTADTLPTAYNSTHRASAISITGHWPGGAMSWATPDGRHNGDTLADGGVSAFPGDDKCGPTTLLNSTRNLNLDHLQAVLLNMKLTPSTLKTDSDREKLALLIKTYMNNGGKHIQFNVVNRETLEDAQKNPEKHNDLIVRVAGYSTYFTLMGRTMQNELIARTQHEL